MPSISHSLRDIMLVVLISQFLLANLSSEDITKLKIQLEVNKVPDFDYDRIIISIDSSSILQYYSLVGYLDSDKNGYNFHMTKDDQNFIAKITIDESDELEECKKDELVDDIEIFEVHYFNFPVDFGKYTNKIKNPKIYTCLAVYQKPDTDLSKTDLFSDKDPSAKAKNSSKLFRLLGKVILAFAELNFKANVLHGDIRPENILVKYVSTTESDREFDPLIENFEMMLENSTGSTKFSGLIRYQSEYRCPELAVLVKKDKVTKEEDWLSLDKMYYYSETFLEDVYALGKTIDKVLETQNDFIIGEQSEIKELKHLASSMTKGIEKSSMGQKPPGEKTIRPDMKEVLQLFLEIMEKHDLDKDNGPNQVFFEQAKESFEFKKDRIIRI